MIQHISAVTLAVQDMARSVEFYEKLGPEVIYGGGYSAFTTLRSGEAFVNLIAAPGYEGRWWGRVFFGSMTLMPTIRVLLWQDSDLRYRRLRGVVNGTRVKEGDLRRQTSPGATESLARRIMNRLRMRCGFSDTGTAVRPRRFAQAPRVHLDTAVPY